MERRNPFRRPMTPTTNGDETRGVAFADSHRCQRDRDRERASARTGAKGKGKDDGLTPEQRRERDAKALQEKTAKKAAGAAAAAGGSGANDLFFRFCSGYSSLFGFSSAIKATLLYSVWLYMQYHPLHAVYRKYLRTLWTALMQSCLRRYAFFIRGLKDLDLAQAMPKDSHAILGWTILIFATTTGYALLNYAIDALIPGIRELSPMIRTCNLQVRVLTPPTSRSVLSFSLEPYSYSSYYSSQGVVIYPPLIREAKAGWLPGIHCGL
ncbi:hypothetical protein LguiB_013420 [Lonicera macranthoides]